MVFHDCATGTVFAPKFEASQRLGDRGCDGKQVAAQTAARCTDNFHGRLCQASGNESVALTKRSALLLGILLGLMRPMIWIRGSPPRRFPVTRANTATSPPGYASQFILLAPTSGLFNPTRANRPPFVVPFLGLHLLAMYPPYNNPQPHYTENGYPQPPQPQQQQPPPPTSRDRDPPHPSAHRLIGTPLDFSTGQFAGKHVRAELIELQKADLGRKYVPHSLSRSLERSFIPLFLIGTLARIADPSTHPRSCNSNFSTRIPAPTGPMRRSRITSCASFLLSPGIAR